MSTFGAPKDPNWRKIRQDVFKRDENLCQLQIEGVCIGTATEVHHTVSIAARGLTRAAVEDTMDDCIAVCRPCHDVVTEKQRKAGFNQMQATRARRRVLPKKPHPGTMTAAEVSS